jgi:hypothetical protein
MPEKRQRTGPGNGEVRFPIGAELVLIVTLILLLSVNRRAASAAETILSLIRSNASAPGCGKILT